MSKMNMVKIDKSELSRWLMQRKENTGENMGYVAGRIGKSSTYFSTVIKKGYMPKAVLSHFCMVYGLNIDSFLAKDDEDIPDSHAEDAAVGYTMCLVVKPDKVRVTINLNGEELYGSWARIKGDTECDLLQAISYASHYCYKMAEQKRFENEMSV